MTASIDVMLPYYGDNEYLRLAVASIQSQTFQDWRLVLVDDNKPGSSAAEWVASLRDARIHHVHNEHNLGVAKNFARCADLVTASHFVMMGSDDICEPDFLESLDRVRTRHPDGDVFQLDVQVIDENGAPSLPLGDRVKRYLRPDTSKGDVIMQGEELAVSLTRADWAYFPSLMWKTATVKRLGFNTNIPIALDLALLLDIALDGGQFVVADGVSFNYRRHRGSVSMAAAGTGARFTSEKDFFHLYASKFQQVGWPTAKRVARRHYISRLNAATEIPGALIARNGTGLRALVRHVVRR